ncbi:hypothetical protein ACFLUQ_02260, partial [Chloroflexota bacterium]
LKERPKAILDTFSAIIGLLFVATFMIGAFFIVRTYFDMGAYTTIKRIPLVPFMVLYFVISVHLFLIFLRSTIGLASKAMGKQFARESYLHGQ